MARIWSRLARKLNTVQLTWVAVLALVIATTAATDGAAAVASAAVTVALVLVVSGRSLSELHSLTAPAIGPPREEQHLRGAFRRQSAPNTPGRPRRPRAPGQVLAAA
ncbi:DUF6412 domain-containing protein [Rhodococcus sp. OK519]|uniref:DUF6412 domain-containing protein n=1 Tax=Rhodococcus sp. OK519 TaxID=2135729 RepID=UPI000D39CC46